MQKHKSNYVLLKKNSFWGEGTSNLEGFFSIFPIMYLKST